ncbi:Conserved_hypothetical protein [Hexamita inflata]|uniref:Transmembrane protein n=1 Tax=Hexamita inflata TaxID=28002 RepID=A0ABP1I0K7_9EUKA
MHITKASESRYKETSGNTQSIAITVPTRGMVGIFPLIVAFVCVGIELLVAFLDIIINAAKGDNSEAESITKSKGVLSSSVLQFHLTWGLVLTATLSFIENSLRWLLNRKSINVFGTLNAIFCTGFVLVALYTWMWANDAAGITFICKYFLLSVNVRISPEQIKVKAYNDTVKFWIDFMLSWLFPIQCVVVLVDCIMSMCCKAKPRQINLKVKNESGRILCKVDPAGL